MNNLKSKISFTCDNTIFEEATIILNKLGLTIDEAIELFLKEVIKCERLPFNLAPSKEHLKALKEGADIIKNPNNYKGYSNMEELKKTLLSDD